MCKVQYGYTVCKRGSVSSQTTLLYAFLNDLPKLSVMPRPAARGFVWSYRELVAICVLDLGEFSTQRASAVSTSMRSL